MTVSPTARWRAHLAPAATPPVLHPLRPPESSVSQLGGGRKIIKRPQRAGGWNNSRPSEGPAAPVAMQIDHCGTGWVELVHMLFRRCCACRARRGLAAGVLDPPSCSFDLQLGRKRWCERTAASPAHDLPALHTTPTNACHAATAQHVPHERL